MPGAGLRFAPPTIPAMTQTLVDQAGVEALLALQQPAWLLKHSNACPISFAALDAFNAYLGAHADEPAGLLVIQEQRPLSNWVATRLSRVHQSPQLFLLAGGKAVWMATHWGITVEAMTAARSAVIAKSQKADPETAP